MNLAFIHEKIKQYQPYLKKTNIFFHAFYLILISGILFLFARHWSYDDPYITYRYASNILKGVGFVYNSGENVLSTTTPLLTLVLVGMGWVWPDLHQLAVLIGSVSLAAGGLILFQIASIEREQLSGWVCLLLYPIFSLTLNTIGSETPLYIALILGAILTYQKRQYLGTGFLAGLVVLARPDGILLPILLAIHFIFIVKSPIPWKAIVIFGLVNIAWFGFAWLYFGSPLPVTLSAKQHQGSMTISQRFLPGFITVLKNYSPIWEYRIAAFLGALGLITITKFRQWNLLLIWTAVYFCAYSILGVSRYFWYYAPLVPGFVVLVSVGLSFLWGLRKKVGGRWKFILAALILGIFSAVLQKELRDLWAFRKNQDPRIAVYTQVGDWLNSNTQINDSVGTLEVGAIGYFSNRRMIDFAGLIQPDVARQLTRNSTYEDSALFAVSQYQPDYIVLHKGLFPRLQEGAIASNCQESGTFQNENILVDIFHCTWK